MEYDEYLNKAKKHLNVADHMIFITYKVVNEPKLLLSVLENIFLSLTNGMAALLHFEQKYKRIPAFSEDFESKFRIFTQHCQKRLNLRKEHAPFIREIKELLIAHRKSSVEFSRKDKLVICSDNYSLKSVGVREIKTYLGKAKIFIQDIDKAIQKNGRVDIQRS